MRLLWVWEPESGDTRLVSPGRARDLVNDGWRYLSDFVQESYAEYDRHQAEIMKAAMVAVNEELDKLERENVRSRS
jgi:hypothetical protein